MAIVQGLMAAWGAIQRILAAIDRFIAFLKAVKSGNAGPPSPRRSRPPPSP